ncbi:hypothetical protein DSO57_1012170, partial [Entomophthora muscae]
TLIPKTSKAPIHGIGDNPSSLLLLPGGLLISGEAVVKSLAYNDLDLYADDHDVPTPTMEAVPVSTPPSLEVNNLVPPQVTVKTSSSPTCIPWLLAGLALMGMNA